MDKHTPGPWTAGNEQHTGNGDTGIVINSRKGYVAHILTNENTGKQAASNARLIAAAPEMLDFIRDAADPSFNPCACDKPSICNGCRARALLAKIEKGE